MNILSLLHDRIHYINIHTPLIGKKTLSASEVELPEKDNKNFTVDIWALYLKEALQKGGVTKFRPQKVHLVLGQRFFTFVRIALPADVQDHAAAPFIYSKIREQFSHLDKIFYKIILLEYRGKRFANVFILEQKTLNSIKLLLSFYEISIQSLYPESLLIFELFHHTLNKQKEEPVLYLEHHHKQSYGLMFDSVGLLHDEIYDIPDSADIKKELKNISKQHKETVARLILGGTKGHEVRQDTFTKEVGIWTNPLIKIFQQGPYAKFGQKYLSAEQTLVFSKELVVLKAHEEKKTDTYALDIKKGSGRMDALIPTVRGGEHRRLGAERSRVSASLRYIAVVVVSLLLSFAIGVFALSQWREKQFSFAWPKNLSLIRKPTLTPTHAPTPTPSPIPTPIVQKENFSIDIQNGVGTPGLAGKLETILEEADYTIGTVGNADSYDHERTVIQAPNKAIFTLLKGDLEGYGVSEPIFEKTSSAENVVIIIGADLEL